MKTKSTMKIVNTRQALHTDENGVQTQRPTTLYLDPAGSTTFVINVPQYIVEALGVPALVRDATADGARTKHHDLMVKFCEHVKTAKAEPVILLEFGYLARDNEDRCLKANMPSFFGDSFDESRFISLQYELAFRVNGRIYNRQEHRAPRDTSAVPSGRRKFPFPDEDITYVPGRVMSYVKGRVLDYTPELEATILALCGAIDRAAGMLKTLNDSKDPAAALLAVKSGLLLAA